MTIEYVALNRDLADRLRPVARRIFTDTFAAGYERDPFEAFCDAAYGPDGTMARDLRSPDVEWLVATCGGEPIGYASPYWMTYRQCQALGGQVRKGEKSTIAIFYKTYAKEVETADDGDDTQTRRVLKSYAVFNTDQCDGLPEMYGPTNLVEAAEPAGREDHLDAFFANVGAQLRHHGCEAYYEPVPDRITMPLADRFEGYDHYYATLAHELSHWSGHGSRLGRDLKNCFGSRTYATEELIAELSAAILGAELGLPVAHLDHHASYIAHWLQLLQSDERAILTAAAKAEEAAALVLLLGRRETTAAISDAHACLADAA